MQFLKQVYTLFFKNLVSNQGVLYTLIDAAEEEECKEIILVYYHLLATDQPMTPVQLDDAIESWMEKTLDTPIDFDINKTLENLASFHAPIGGQEKPLLQYDEHGHCRVLSLDEANELIDYVWDTVFAYSNPGRPVGA